MTSQISVGLKSIFWSCFLCLWLGGCFQPDELPQSRKLKKNEDWRNANPALWNKLQKVETRLIRHEMIEPFAERLKIFTFEEAYRIQDVFQSGFEGYYGPKVGYKIAFTNPEAMKKWGMVEPVYGHLYALYALENNGHLRVSRTHHLMIECELAVIIGKEIDQKLRSVSEVKDHVASVHPALDVSDFMFRDAPTKFDIIATGAGAHRYVLGEGQGPRDLFYEDIELSLSHNGERVYHGHARNTMGNPWEALIWIAHKQIRRGASLKKGDIVLLGAVDAPYHPQGSKSQGKLIGDCGALGQVVLSLKP